MTDTDHALDEMARAAAELLPALGERLARHGLGEIEVTRGDLRLRVAGTPAAAPAAAPTTRGPAHAPATDPAATDAGPGPEAQPTVGVTSPAVGFFVYAEGLGPGMEVASGDALGQVEMLGVRHDVRAPRAGTVRHLVAESGEAVEYGQVVVELEAGTTR